MEKRPAFFFLTDSATVNWTRTDLAVLFLQVFIKG